MRPQEVNEQSEQPFIAATVSGRLSGRPRGTDAIEKECF